MSNLFPKKYVIERIDARVGNIDLEVSRLEPQIEAWKAAQVETLDKHLETVVATLDGYTTRLKLALKEYRAADGFDAKRKILEAFAGNISMPYLPRVADTRTHKGGTNAVGDIAAQVQALRAEKVSLLHAKTYLDTMPVDEFSMTSLSKLGLTQVLKFRLEEYAG